MSACNLYLKSIPFNFYAIVMILVSIGIMLFNLKFDDIINKISNVKENEGEGHGHGHEAHEQSEFEEKASPRPFNLIFPLSLLITTTFFFFWYTRKGKAQGFTGAIMNVAFEKINFTFRCNFYCTHYNILLILKNTYGRN